MSRPAAEVAADAGRRGAQVHRVGPATSKAALLAGFARALEFPDWFGGNWDALVDSLRDLSWLPSGPHAVVWAGSGALKAAHPGTYETALEVLRQATADSAGTERPLTVLLADDG